jgi:leader peptidase (prepilin peptidase)/N-methyltransferase
VIGLYLGAAVAPAFLVAFAVGTIFGIAIIMRKGMVQGRKTAVPFGPFLALGALVGILAGNELVNAYVGTF